MVVRLVNMLTWRAYCRELFENDDDDDDDGDGTTLHSFEKGWTRSRQDPTYM